MSYSAEVLTDSPSGFWKFQEASGATAADASGNGRDGTYSSIANYHAAGPGGDLPYAVHLSPSSSSHVALPTLSWVDATNGITISGWFNVANHSLWARLVELGSGQQHDNLLFMSYDGDNGEFAAQLYNGIGGSGGTMVLGGEWPDTNVWHHAALTIEADGDALLYFDGVQVGSANVGAPAIASRTTNYIGKSSFSGDPYYDGWVAGVAIFPTALSGSRISAHYAAASPTFTGTAASTLRAVTQSVVGTFTPPILTGAAASVLPSLRQSARGSYAPPPAELPGTVPLSRVDRFSWIYPIPTMDEDTAQPSAWKPSSYVYEQWARYLQLVIDGQDWTERRGLIVEILSWSEEQPGTYGTLVFRFPAHTMYDSLDDELEHLALGPDVQLYKILPGGTRGRLVFDGAVTGPQDSDSGLGRTFECQGVYHLDTVLRADNPPQGTVVPRDIADVIVEVLDTTPAPRLGPTIRGDDIGVLDQTRGSQGQTKADRINDLLARSTTNDGQTNHTIIVHEDRRPEIVAIPWPDDATPDYTIRAGQPGITLNIEKDLTTAPKVIWATGVAPDGCRWYGLRAPRPMPDDGMPWCGTLISIGTVDADTASGTGVTDLQRRLKRIGFDVDITGVWTDDDASEVEDLQLAAGLTETGAVDDDTWNEAFRAHADTGDLNTVVRRPMAYWSSVEPFLWDAHGGILGDNPNFDDSILRVEIDLDMGEGIRKKHSRKLLRRMLQRDATAFWTGEATFEADPNECSRYDMRSHRILGVQQLHGTTSMNFYIPGLDVDFAGGTVTTKITRAPLNLMGFNAIRERNRAARQNPAGKFFQGLIHQSRMRKDSIVPWLCEDGAGLFPDDQDCPAEQWTDFRFLGAQLGDIARTVVTTSPATEFVFGIFGKPDFLDVLNAHVPTPLDMPVSTPWDEDGFDGDVLDEAGLIMSWGSADLPAGYGRRGLAGGLTGRLIDDAPWPFASLRPPWLWGAIYPRNDTTVRGFLRIAADG